LIPILKYIGTSCTGSFNKTHFIVHLELPSEPYLGKRAASPLTTGQLTTRLSILALGGLIWTYHIFSFLKQKPEVKQLQNQ